MIKKIAIIGDGGRMGTWFSKYFSRRKGIKLLLYDINASSLKGSNNTRICEDIVNCVGRADLVMVCVPISEIPHTIQECATKMKSGAILVEAKNLERLISGNNLFRMRSTLEKLKSFYQEQQSLELSYTQMYRIISYLNKSESHLS